VEKALMKADIVASFIAQDGDKALFVGLYRRGKWRTVTNDQFLAIPAIAELRPFGQKGIEGRETRLWFELERTDIYSEWKGRLVVKWPSGRLWWRWAKSNSFPIHAIYEESLLDAEMLSWDQLSLTWEQMRVLPTKLKAALRQWRGIYYIFDVKLARGYVGSAYGGENILGRWQNYAKSGHGGKQEAQEAGPKQLSFHDPPANITGRGARQSIATGSELERSLAYSRLRPERQLIPMRTVFNVPGV
jgi:hypothetical protein